LALPAAVIAMVACAELLVAHGAPAAGLAIDVALLLALANGVLFAHSRTDAKLLAVLALVPLLRPVGLVMAIDGVPREYWPALAGAPMLMAVVWASRTLDFPLTALLRPADRRWTRAAALCGPLLGLGAYALAGPPQPQLEAPGLLLAAAGLALFGAVPQEILFRGLLQRLLVDRYGGQALTLVALNALFAATLVGTSLTFAVYMGAVGLGFSVVVRRSGTLGEVVISQALLSICGLLVWPLLLG